MNSTDDGHIYITDDGQLISFIRKENGQLVQAGTTNEELIAILIDRIKRLHFRVPCPENGDAIKYLTKAAEALSRRTLLRVAQGVEGTDRPHTSELPEADPAGEPEHTPKPVIPTFRKPKPCQGCGKKK